MGEDNDRNDTIENARIGYQVAVNLMNHEEQQMWARSGTILVVNSIIIALIGMFLSNPGKTWISPKIAITYMSAAGLCLCFLWLCITERTAKKAIYWLRSAAILEKNHLSKPIKTLTRVKKLSDNGKVCLDDGGESIQIRCWGHWGAWGHWKHHFRIKYAPLFMIFGFSITYVYCIPFVWISDIPTTGVDHKESNKQLENRVDSIEKRIEAIQNPIMKQSNEKNTKGRSPSKQSSISDIWNRASTLISVAGALVCVFLGYFLKSWRESHKDKNKLKNIRKMFFKEMEHNYELIILHMPPEEETDLTSIRYLAGVLNELPSSVYDNYLDRLCELPAEEVDEIYKAYSWIKESIKIGVQAQEMLDRGEVDKSYTIGLIKHSEATLEVISMALQLFKGGKDTLDSLQKERGSKLEVAKKLEQIINQTNQTPEQ